jgi:integrase/recombinase XerD
MKLLDHKQLTWGFKAEAEANPGPLFRPLNHNGKQTENRRRMDPDAIDRVVRKYAGAELGLLRDYSAHSMRATFITTALENGAQLEDLQKAPGHADPGTTKLGPARL